MIRQFGPEDAESLDRILDRVWGDTKQARAARKLPWRSPRMRHLDHAHDVLHRLWLELHADELAALLKRP